MNLEREIYKLINNNKFPNINNNTRISYLQSIIVYYTDLLNNINILQEQCNNNNTNVSFSLEVACLRLSEFEISVRAYLDHINYNLSY